MKKVIVASLIAVLSYSQVASANQSAQQLQDLVAPIALYPDALVAQVLAAATHPRDVVLADQWMQQHANLAKSQLAQEVDKQPWDPSVRALTQFPTVLANLDQNLSWASALGDAYTNQSQDVFNAVQVMRKKAEAAGTLQSTPQQTVSNQGQTIVIQPANPQVVYVPAYDPWYVYGSPLVAYPGWVPMAGVYVGTPGIAFGLGFGVDVFAGYGWGWNHWRADWHDRHVYFDRHEYFGHDHGFGHRDFHGGFEHGGFHDHGGFHGGGRIAAFHGGGFHGGFHGGGGHHR